MDSKSNIVYEYMISQHQDAVKQNDEISAISLLKASEYFNNHNPNATIELYFTSKNSGDVASASKCLADLFHHLFIPLQHESKAAIKLEVSTIINQLREELRILVGELKTHHLKLKACAAPAMLLSRQTPSVSQSPMLSPRARLASDDRSSNSKLSESHIHSTSRIIFYNQLFEQLPDATKKAIIDNLILNSDNSFETCRLMMLAISIMGETFHHLSARLIKNLISLSNPPQPQEDNKSNVINPRTVMMCRYARSLLVLDAIPLVLGLPELSDTEIDMDCLFEQTLRFISEYCLETAASEYEFSELHEGVKKTIASRILGLEMNSASRDGMEESALLSLHLLNQRYIDNYPKIEIKQKLNELRALVSDRGNPRFEQIMAILTDIGLFDSISHFTFSGHPPTPPPKTRGRPKKKPVVSPSVDEVSKKQLEGRLMLERFIFFNLVEFLLSNCSYYLRSTKSRILINFGNPMASQFEQSKATSHRSSRSKNASQPSTNPDAASPPTKKVKTESGTEMFRARGLYNSSIQNSPLSTEQSKNMDKSIINTVREACLCRSYLSCDEHPNLAAMWNEFAKDCKLSRFEWFERFEVDAHLAAGEYGLASTTLESILSLGVNDQIKAEENVDVKPNISAGSILTSDQTSVDLRRLTQLISTRVQEGNKERTFQVIDQLLGVLKKCGILNGDESYSSGNIISEYMITAQGSIGFLFFDTISLVRYCVDILMEILEHHVANQSTASDSAIGHTIILSQFDWPKEVEIYTRCIDWIRTIKPKSTTPQYLSPSTKFTYPEFFHFAKNPSLIEDFMALLRQGYTLDIKDRSGASSVQPITGLQPVGSDISPGSRSNSGGATSTRSGKAITTRGVNKTFKEDLKVAMVTQMKGSSTLIPLDMVSEFVRMSVIPYLSNFRAKD